MVPTSFPTTSASASVEVAATGPRSKGLHAVPGRERKGSDRQTGSDGEHGHDNRARPLCQIHHRISGDANPEVEEALRHDDGRYQHDEPQDRHPPCRALDSREDCLAIEEPHGEEVPAERPGDDERGRSWALADPQVLFGVEDRCDRGVVRARKGGCEPSGGERITAATRFATSDGTRDPTRFDKRGFPTDRHEAR